MNLTTHSNYAWQKYFRTFVGFLIWHLLQILFTQDPRIFLLHIRYERALTFKVQIIFLCHNLFLQFKLKSKQIDLLVQTHTHALGSPIAW